MGAAGVEAVDDDSLDVEADDPEPGAAGLLGERQADVAEADDGEVEAEGLAVMVSLLGCDA